VKLVGHDWGGWIGYLLCLRAPERFERYLALNILTPWLNLREIVPNTWRFTYQLVVAAPGLGYRLHTSGALVPRVLVGASVVRDNWDAETLRIFTDNLAEPDRARACVQMYRVFQLHEQPALMRGRYARQRLAVPTLHVHGADDMRVELVPGCGHFIADELPDLVAARAVEFFA